MTILGLHVVDFGIIIVYVLTMLWIGHRLSKKMKTTEDFYSTMMRSKNRLRLYREILRYELDLRFTQLIIMVEGSLKDFMEYSPKFNGKLYNQNHSGANVASRRSTVAGLFARGVQVLWCGSREQAVKLYPQMIRQYCIKNYTKILNLENSQ